MDIRKFLQRRVRDREATRRTENEVEGGKRFVFSVVSVENCNTGHTVFFSNIASCKRLT